jgi:MFS family permease
VGTKASSATTVLVAASAAQAAVSFVAFGLPAIGPELRRAFGLSLPELGAVLTASFLGSSLTLVAAGVAVDRFGPRAAMLVGTPLASGGLIAASFGDSKPLLFAALVVSGIGSSVVPVAGTGALFQAFPASRRGWALGVRQMAVPLGGTAAAVALPLLDAVGGVRLPLLVAAAAVAGSGIAFAMVSNSEATPRRPSARAFRTILAAPGMRRLLAVASLYILVLQALLTFAVPSIRAAGFSRLSASIAFVAINLTAMGARLVWGRIADRSDGTRRSRTLAEIGLVAAGGGIAFAVSLHVAAPVVAVAAVLFAFGAMGWNAIVYVSAGERTTPELANRSVALALTVVFLVSAVSTPLLGVLADRAGWSAFWLVTAGLALGGASIAGSLADTRTTV